MSDVQSFAPGSHSLRLETLIRLRWLAVAGQTATVLIVKLVLGYPLPIAYCFALIALSACLNIAIRIRYPASYRLGNAPAAVLLGYDVLQLGCLLYLTGGLDNPFTILLLVPLIVSATTLAPRPTFILGLLVVGMSSVLALDHWPLPWDVAGNLDIPLIYSLGVWVALVSASVFTGTYAFRVAEEARQLAKALNATEMVLTREHHLSALDGLAAAAAHQLGTPLATIALVAKELELAFEPNGPHSEDIALLRSQVKRCRDILAKLTSLSTESYDHLARQPLSHLIEEAVEPFRAFATEIAVAPGAGAGAEPIGRRNPAIVHGLTNLVENAVDFARSRVDVASEWDEHRVSVTIGDDGPGFAPGIIQRIGEPYVTTRAPSGDGGADHEAGGLGLGFFIAKTLLERSGARVTLANREAPRTGALVRVEWPRERMEEVLEPATVVEALPG